MTERDPEALADHLEHEADRMQAQSERLATDVQDAQQDWQRKRADPGVAGAVPGTEEDSDEEQAEGSPAPQAPPAGSGPSDATMPPEGAVGPPKEQLDEDRESDEG